MKYLARIVNKAAEGESEHPVLQIPSAKTFEFSQIKWVREKFDIIKPANLTDADLNQDVIQYILNTMNQQCEITFDENDNVTIFYFYDTVA